MIKWSPADENLSKALLGPYSIVPYDPQYNPISRLWRKVRPYHESYHSRRADYRLGSRHELSDVLWWTRVSPDGRHESINGFQFEIAQRPQRRPWGLSKEKIRKRETSTRVDQVFSDREHSREGTVSGHDLTGRGSDSGSQHSETSRDTAETSGSRGRIISVFQNLKRRCSRSSDRSSRSRGGIPDAPHAMHSTMQPVIMKVDPLEEANPKTRVKKWLDGITDSE